LTVLQRPGAHEAPVVSMQAPRPSQVRPFAVLPSQVTPLPQAAPFGKSAHVPEGPHFPLFPQVVESSAGHRSPGSVPTAA
jgi:hypothetical protein